jgi:hypothetical protein
MNDFISSSSLPNVLDIPDTPDTPENGSNDPQEPAEPPEPPPAATVPPTQPDPDDWTGPIIQAPPIASPVPIPERINLWDERLEFIGEEIPLAEPPLNTDWLPDLHPQPEIVPIDEVIDFEVTPIPIAGIRSHGKGALLVVLGMAGSAVMWVKSKRLRNL